MELPTKEERHKIYIRAKEIYRLKAPNTGMCVSIVKAWKNIPTFGDPLHQNMPGYGWLVNTAFPEMAKIKPKEEHLRDNRYWWSKDHIEKRIKKFDEIIKMTE